VDKTSTINILDVWRMSQLSHIGLLTSFSVGIKSNDCKRGSNSHSQKALPAA
jgi:hypothetical protein